jgi:hypothetical protein
MATLKLHLRAVNPDWGPYHWNDLNFEHIMAAMYAASLLEPPPACLICERRTRKPASFGWTNLDAMFVICSACDEPDVGCRPTPERLKLIEQIEARLNQTTSAA